MRNLAIALMGVALLCLGYAGRAAAVQVTIDPAGYTGQWTVDYGPATRGVAVVALGNADPATGSHVLSIGGAELHFDVAADGQVTVENRAAATGGPGTLTLKTATLYIDPVYFSGRWRITDGATPDLSGPQLVTLVPGLEFYGLEVGANGGFAFDFGADRRVRVRNDVAAFGSLGYLRLRNTQRFLSGAP